MLVDGGVLAIFSTATVVVHVVGVAHAAHAVMNVRSSQGAIAWSISLITFPWLAIPLYWILGRTKFHGYAETLRSVYAQHYKLVHQTYSEVIKFQVTPPDNLAKLQLLAEALTEVSFTSGNAAELLINGQQTYEAMLKKIASATNYILLQSYTVNDDQSGNEFKKALIAKAKEGSSFSYYTEMETIGIRLYRYKNGFMHQKIIVIDENIAGVGTVNLDNRSFSLNFEVMGFVTEPRFVQSVKKMLEDDLAVCVAVDLDEYDKKPFWFKLAVRVSRLLTPLL